MPLNDEQMELVSKVDEMLNDECMPTYSKLSKLLRDNSEGADERLQEFRKLAIAGLYSIA